MEKLIISHRLKEIAKHLNKGVFFADIGSDHAYLPSFVCLNDPLATCIAGEVNEGPFNQAKEVVAKYHLEDRIDVRLGDGLAVLKDSTPEAIVIAGMGGKLIESILLSDLNKTKNINQLILQPNIDAHRLRQWFLNHNYQLEDELVIQENNHYYEILIAKKNSKVELYNQEISIEKQILFGPKLLKERSVEFLEKWRIEMEKVSFIINQIKQAKQINNTQLMKFKKRQLWIEEVLRNEVCQ